MYPGTVLGRVVSVASAVMGICMVAILVNAVGNLVKMDADEENAMAFLSKGSSFREKRRLAANLIRRFLKFASARKAKEREAHARAGAEPAAAQGAAPAHAHVRVPHSATAPLIAALHAWRSYKHALNLEERKADTTAVVDDKCTTMLTLLTELKMAVEGLKAEVAEMKKKA